MAPKPDTIHSPFEIYVTPPPLLAINTLSWKLKFFSLCDFYVQLNLQGFLMRRLKRFFWSRFFIKDMVLNVKKMFYLLAVSLHAWTTRSANGEDRNEGGSWSVLYLWETETGTFHDEHGADSGGDQPSWSLILMRIGWGMEVRGGKEFTISRRCLSGS